VVGNLGFGAILTDLHNPHVEAGSGFRNGAHRGGYSRRSKRGVSRHDNAGGSLNPTAEHFENLLVGQGFTGEGPEAHGHVYEA
jgi:hypothetical protein